MNGRRERWSPPTRQPCRGLSRTARTTKRRSTLTKRVPTRRCRSRMRASSTPPARMLAAGPTPMAWTERGAPQGTASAHGSGAGKAHAAIQRDTCAGAPLRRGTSDSAKQNAKRIKQSSAAGPASEVSHGSHRSRLTRERHQGNPWSPAQTRKQLGLHQPHRTQNQTAEVMQFLTLARTSF